MKKHAISSPILKQFVEAALKKLTGDWVMIGGTVLPYLGFDHRATMDIDMVGPEDSSTQETLKLMEIAESLGLPVETINQAEAYFYFKAQPQKSDLVLLKESKNCRVLRPNAGFFVILKFARLSQSDLEDCILMIKNFGAEITPKQKSQILKMIDLRVRNVAQYEELRDRLESLKSALLAGVAG